MHAQVVTEPIELPGGIAALSNFGFGGALALLCRPPPSKHACAATLPLHCHLHELALEQHLFLLHATGSNIHALIEGVRIEDGPQQGAWSVLQDEPTVPRKPTRLLPLATRTAAGLQALADAIKACPGEGILLLSVVLY